MTRFWRTIRPALGPGFLTAVVLTTAPGCGGNKSEAPAQFSPNPTDPPTESGKGGKKGGEKRGVPPEKFGDG